MKIATIIDHIDNGHIALPEFQRGYVWNRTQVRGLFDSLYRRHPVGGLLTWATESESADHRGEGQLAAGIVKLLLDGQQRVTSLYGVVRGKPPAFFDGDERAFTGLRFHLETETFEFYQPVKMRDDPLWVDVTELMQQGNRGLGDTIARIAPSAAKFGDYTGRLSNILAIKEVDLHIEEVIGADKSLDVVVDIFNRVNSGGTKLSKGDLALAKVCANWPDARNIMKTKLEKWESAGYAFTRDWLLRSVNTVLTGEAQFQYLHEKSAAEIQDGMARATRQIDQCLNYIGGRLGLDHDRVFFGRFAVPVMARYLDQRQAKRLGPMGERERDKLLFWYVQAAMWGRFSGSTETVIDQDLEALEAETGGLDRLLERLRLWHGGSFRAQPAHFTGWSLGARFYPVLYFLTRMGEARDWGTGLPLRSDLLGRMSRLEVHHIFPKARLYESDRNYIRPEVNAIANFCFLTKDTNLVIRDRAPQAYFPEVEASHPGALASQWVPDDPALWRIDRFRDFLEARQELLANELNCRMEELLHGDMRWVSDGQITRQHVVPGGIDSAEEEQQLEALNTWVSEKGLPRGEVAYDFADVDTGEQKAVLDLAWPNGIQVGLSEPVAVLLNEGASTLAMASQGGFRCFASTAGFRHYVQSEILNEDLPA